MAQSAAAGRWFAAPSGDDVPPPSAPASGPFVLHRRSHTGGGASPASDTLARSRSASNLVGAASGFYAGHLPDTLQLGDNVRALGARDDVAALIDFLRNHPPPPDNFMSTPYAADAADAAEQRGRWSKIKKMGKRGRRSKSAPRAPRNLRLPDSAVSGTTTGGHRHIAISIPLEASPVGAGVRSQYPVYPQQDLSVGTPSKEPVRTYTNDKGVVTVLRPVAEVSESWTSSLPQPRSPPDSGGQWLPGQRPKTSHALGYGGLGGGKPHDYIGILPTRFDAHLLDDGSAPWNRAPARGDGPGRGGQPPRTFQRSAYPTRCSSIVAGRNLYHPASIDGLISQQERCGNATYGPRGANASEPDVNGTVPKPAAPTECATQQPRPNQTNKPAPMVASWRPARQDSQGPSVAVVSDNPIVSRGDDSPPPTPGSTSRRDVVRHKKQRDMEALRNAMHRKTLGRREDAGETDKPRPAGQPSDDARGPAEGSGNGQPARQLAMSGMMVVVDVKPCPFLEERAAGPPSDARPDSPELLLPARGADIPTPRPVSADGSPPPATHSVTDRTSLTRRREWKATLEQERKARDAMALARAKAQQLASGGVSYDGRNGPQTDKAIVGLYEAYREHRLKDMERRLRRLERNGDVWLQALGPILDNRGRTVAAASEEPAGAARDCASDDEAASVVERVGRDAEHRRVTRRTSLSQGRLLEKLADHGRDHEDSWSDSVSRGDDYDASGLGAMEPLMRELAGEARRRQGTKTARTLAICDEAACRAI